jgi:hypothetical protein
LIYKKICLQFSIQLKIKNLLEQSGYKLKLFNSLFDDNVEIKQLTYETKIAITKPLDIESFKGCISSVFTNESSIYKGGIFLRFKRVSNFNKVTSLEAFILEKSEQGYRGSEIIEALLENFKDNHRVLGVTPEKIGKIAIQRGIPTIIDYFNKEISQKIFKKYGKAQIITATNVFAHMDNINKIMKYIINLLKNDGIFVSESHYLLPLIKDLQYDTIYHEHIRYYSLMSLNFLFKKHNIEIIDVKEIPTHGGSIRVYAARKGYYKISKNVNKQLNKEEKFLTKENFLVFKDKVVLSKMKLYKLIYNIKKNGHKIYGIGAPSRATTLINYVGLNHDLIDCVLEVEGSYKIGNYIPGTKIPILSEKNLLRDQPKYLILFSWHIYKDLKRNLRNKGYKGKFIIPLPDPRIEI